MVNSSKININNFNSFSKEFLDTVFEELQVLLHHSFTAIQQPTFQNELKSALNINEYNFASDFTEPTLLFCTMKSSHLTGITYKP
jgi:hypothetical protein